MIAGMDAMTRACETVGGVKKLADLLGVAESTVTQWRKGIRPIPLRKGVQIEIATKQLVTRRDLYPNEWQDIWPELATQAPTTTEPASAGV